MATTMFPDNATFRATKLPAARFTRIPLVASKLMAGSWHSITSGVNQRFLILRYLIDSQVNRGRALAICTIARNRVHFRNEQPIKLYSAIVFVSTFGQYKTFDPQGKRG